MTEPRTIPVEAARAAVLASGQLAAIDGPYFLAAADADWADFHVDREPPIAARVIVTRVGQEPRKITIGWAEYEQQESNDPEWNELRARKPMAIFGSEVERHAYRVVFADILAPLLESGPARIDASTYADDASAPTDPTARDWAAEIDAAQTVLDIDTIDRDARAARAFRPDAAGTALHRQMRAKRKALTGDATAVDEWAPAPGPSENAQGPAAPERASEVQAGIRRPQDHLPGNRETRRAAKRKSGRRR